MEQRALPTVVFVFLASIIYGEIKGSTQSVSQPCERNKRAISLCQTSSENRPSGFLTYNMSASPDWCNCTLSTDQEDVMDVQYATTVDNRTYDFVFHVARDGGGNITGRDGHWNDSISEQMTWTVHLSKANLTEHVAVQGLCFSYEAKNDRTRFSILCHTSMELRKPDPKNISLIILIFPGVALAAVVVALICQMPRCVRRDGRFSTKEQDDVLTALQRASSRGEEKEGLEKTTDGHTLPLPDHTAQGECIFSSEVIHDGGVVKENSAGGCLGTTREAGSLGHHIYSDDAQNAPSADGGRGTSNDDAEEIQMVDNIVYETCSGSGM